MTNTADNDEVITKEIHNTLETSKGYRDKNPLGVITAQHFHSYEYLVSLLARRQALSNNLIERLTSRIVCLTIVVVLLAIVQIVADVLRAQH